MKTWIGIFLFGLSLGATAQEAIPYEPWDYEAPPAFRMGPDFHRPMWATPPPDYYRPMPGEWTREYGYHYGYSYGFRPTPHTVVVRPNVKWIPVRTATGTTTSVDGHVVPAWANYYCFYNGTVWFSR